jgi:hypothetical protein
MMILIYLVSLYLIVRKAQWGLIQSMKVTHLTQTKRLPKLSVSSASMKHISCRLTSILDKKHLYKWEYLMIMSSVKVEEMKYLKWLLTRV